MLRVSCILKCGSWFHGRPLCHRLISTHSLKHSSCKHLVGVLPGTSLSPACFGLYVSPLCPHNTLDITVFIASLSYSVMIISSFVYFLWKACNPLKGSSFVSFTIVCLGEGNGNPLQHSCLENPMDGGAWWAEVHGVVKNRTRLSDFTFTFHIHALEKEMATHSSVLAWRIPGTGEPGGLPSMGSHRVGHD